MADDIASLKIRIDALDARTGRLELEKLNATGKKSEVQADKTGLAFGRMAGALAGLTISGLATAFIKVADSMKSMESRLSLVTRSSKDLADTQAALFDMSQRTRTGYAESVDLYARLARSTESLGASQTDLLRVTETINKSFVISGATAEQSRAALIQLGQAFASGTLRGDELNSVMEQAPRLAEAIAKGMGITVGQLRALGAEGKLTSEQIFTAIKKSGQAVDEEFKRMPTTVGQATTQLGNSISKAVAELDKATGASSAVAESISQIAVSIGDAGKIASENKEVIFGVLGALGGAVAAAGIARVAAALAGAGGLVGAIAAVRTGIVALAATLAANPVALALILGGAAIGVANSKTVTPMERTVKAAEDLLKVTERIAAIESRPNRTAAQERELATLKAGADRLRETIRLNGERMSAENGVAVAAEANARATEKVATASKNSAKASREQIDLLKRQEEATRQINDILVQVEMGYMPEEDYDLSTKMAEQVEAVKETDDAARQLGLTFSSAFEDAVVGGKKFSEVLKGLADDIMRMLVRKNLTEPLVNAISGGGGAGGLFSGLLGGFGNLFGGGAASNSVMGIDLSSASENVFSFDGGGYTGNGSRAGGLDGKGGFMAMMHPRETVIDHTKGQTGAIQITNSPVIQIDSRTDRAAIMADVERANKQANAELVDKLQRAGRI